MHRDAETQEPPSRRLLQSFLWNLIAASAALLAIAAAHYYSLYRSDRGQRETAERVSLELVRQVMVADLAAVVTDLMVLTRHVEEMALPRTSARDTDLERVFVIFAEQKRLYDQIRFIDADGRETLRVDLRGDRAFTVPPSELQDKSGRYYVAKAERLAPGDIYISPLDLNVEKGEIERPLKPVVRFAAGIFDAEGRRAGIVVLNYLGQRLLDGMREAAGATAAHLQLVDPQGFWLQGPDPRDDWGFMLGSEHTFGGRFPGEWERIRAGGRGQLLTANGLFTFATVSPRPVALAAIRNAGTNAGDTAAAQADGYFWKIVSHLPITDLALAPGQFLAEHGAL